MTHPSQLWGPYQAGDRCVVFLTGFGWAVLMSICRGGEKETRQDLRQGKGRHGPLRERDGHPATSRADSERERTVGPLHPQVLHLCVNQACTENIPKKVTLLLTYTV